MEVIFSKTFTKQYEKLPASVQDSAITFIKELKSVETLRDLKDVKKLAGFKNVYRARIGNYRIGMYKEDAVTCVCVMERSQIYKVFPPK